jgi:hypothetical protein
MVTYPPAELWVLRSNPARVVALKKSNAYSRRGSRLPLTSGFEKLLFVMVTVSRKKRSPRCG